MNYNSVLTPLDYISQRFEAVGQERPSRSIGWRNYISGFQGESTRRVKMDSRFLQEVFLQHYSQRIRSFRRLGTNWDSFGSSPPSELAIQNALLALPELLTHHFLPVRITPSADESILFEGHKNGLRYVFEFFNNGDIVLLQRTKDEERAFDISLEEIADRVSELSDA